MKNLRQRTVIQAALLIGCFALPAFAAENPNALTGKEKQAGFRLLFNGRNFEGWEQKGNWTLEDGAIFRSKGGGEITYRAQSIPDDFELRFQWKVAKGSNSGVYYRPGQYEYQILDNKVHKDGRNPRTSAASLYFCMAPSKDATKPVGQWNSGRIVCKGPVVQHWLNGQKVIDFDYTDPQWAFNVELLHKRGADLPARGALLHMQDHGDPVWYRGIKLRSLPADEKLDTTPVKPQTISQAVLKAEQQKIEGILKDRRRKAKQK